MKIIQILLILAIITFFPSLMLASEIAYNENVLIVQYYNTTNEQFSKNISSHILTRKKINYNTEIITFNDESNLDLIINELQKNKTIKNIEKDTLLKIPNEEQMSIFFKQFNFTTTGYPKDHFYNLQWYLQYLKLNKIWNQINMPTNPVIVGVIDTGIETKHEDLLNKIHPEGYNFILNNNNIYDSHGHGTTVSGIIAAETNNYLGISGITGELDIKLLPLQVSEDGLIKTSNCIKAINYAIEKNADIVNMSFSSSYNSEILNQTIQNAINHGIIFIAGSGNNGYNNYHYPASYDNVISVGSIDQNENISYFSNYNDKIDLVAPGEMIYTTTIGNSYDYKKGTSYSTAIITGIVAILKSINPNLTQQEIYDILITTADDKGDVGKDIYYGYGVINALNAFYKIIETEQDIYKEWEAQYNVDKNKLWTITFNQNINKITVNLNSVYITDNNNNKLIQDVFVVNNKILINPPLNGYSSENSYTLYINKDIESENNKKNSNAIKMIFTIR